MLKGEGIAARTLLHLMQSELARREDSMFLAEQMDVANTAYIYTFGCVGIVFSVLLIVLGIIFMARKVDLNYSFGYRSYFSLSTSKTWKWCNKVFFLSVFSLSPLFLIAHVVVFALSLIYDWSFAWVVITMASGMVYLIPVTLFIEIYGRIKFKDLKADRVEPLVENEKSKRQDIDDFWD